MRFLDILKETVYIETSIIGYLTARPTSNLIVAANMQTTKSWWDNKRDNFDIYISEIVCLMFSYLVEKIIWLIRF